MSPQVRNHDARLFVLKAVSDNVHFRSVMLAAALQLNFQNAQPDCSVVPAQ